MSITNDELRDLNAKLLAKVQNDVQKEPTLLPIPSNVARNMRGNVSPEARLDVRARGFWRPAQNAFFDVRVTNPFSATAMKSSLEKVCDYHEREKKNAYNHRIINIDHGTMTPLIYTVFGSVGKECDKFYKHLCQKIADKSNEKYDDVISWVRCKISFLCIKSCIRCLRDSRVIKKSIYISDDFSMDNHNANMF